MNFHVDQKFFALVGGGVRHVALKKATNVRDQGIGRILTWRDRRKRWARTAG